MTGFRTIIFGVVLAVAPALFDYLGGVSWDSLGVSPTAAAVIGMVVCALRYFTTTPIFQKLK